MVEVQQLQPLLHVKFVTLNPPPTGSNTLTFDVKVQASAVPFTIPAGTLLSIEVYANGVSPVSSPILSKIISAGTTLTGAAISLNPLQYITGTDLTTNTSVGFDVNVELL
jgi:hypothetical protein